MIGPDKELANSGGVLNRTIKWMEEGITLEVNQRHVCDIEEELEFGPCKPKRCTVKGGSSQTIPTRTRNGQETRMGVSPGDSEYTGMWSPTSHQEQGVCWVREGTEHMQNEIDHGR